MSRSSTERKRQTRRAEYQAQHPTAQKEKVIGYVAGHRDYPFTAAQWQEYIDSGADKELTALHESSHAVAAWMLGVPIIGMEFKNTGRPRLFDAPDSLAAVTMTGIPEKEILAKSKGERLVQARLDGFITLAGPFGTCEAVSENPFHMYETNDHLFQAVAVIMKYAGISEREAREEVTRLLNIVDETMAGPRVQATVKHLAKTFLRMRVMTGEEVTACIAGIWNSAPKKDAG
jgi:hypothetical protein